MGDRGGRMGPRRWVIPAAMLASLAVCVAAQPNPEDPESPAAAQARGRGQLDELLSPLLAGSGTWRAPNHEHVPGDQETAAYWRLEHEWIFERTLMRYRILGELEDGATTTYWEGTVAWDPRAEVAHVMQVHRAGIFGSGSIRRTGPDAVRFDATFWHPGGGAELFRDEMRWTSPGHMVSRSQTYDAGEWAWVEKRVEHWTLVDDAP